MYIEQHQANMACMSALHSATQHSALPQLIISKKKKILQGMKNNPVRPPECVCCCVADRNEWMGMNYMLYFEKIFSFPD